VTSGGRLTVAAIGVTAFALCDLVHEVAGHGLAVLLVPGVQAISLSSVALQTTGASRLVAAAGSMANIIAGCIAMALFQRQRRFSAGAYFLWLFGAVNLLNGCGIRSTPRCSVQATGRSWCEGWSLRLDGASASV